MRKFPPKRSLRATIADNMRALDMYADLAGKPRMERPAILQKPVRKVVNRTDESELEASVMREVGLILANHPRVLFAVRQNSGSASMPGRNGEAMPVWFYRWAKSRQKMRISDFWGFTTDGKPLALECKRRSWTHPSDDREHEQATFLAVIREIGGRADFVTSAEQAKAVIEQV